MYKTKSLFAVGITVGKTTYNVHGVNRNGHFGNTPYMNGEVFPVLPKLEDYSNPFYGKDRYDIAFSALSEAGENFSVEDALQLLSRTRQEGQWGTRVSFAYSKNRNAVYYFPDGDISRVEIHSFSPEVL